MGWQIGTSKAAVDYLVIGSGFGGSVMAATLAEAGKEVCLFERGKAYPPGSFPRGVDGLGTNFWHPPGQLHGMYDVRSFKGIDSVVASGLGGGSLIYANVMLEKPSSWFEQQIPGADGTETWAFDYNALRCHYREVKRYLQVQTLPREFEAEISPKTGRLKSASPDTTESAPLAVRFRRRGVGDDEETPAPGTDLPDEDCLTVHGRVKRTTCTMCGECDIGCNDGAKNSMDHTYLTKANTDGAEICIRTEARHILRNAAGSEYLFQVQYVVYTEDGESALRSISAKRVILAAGTFGTTRFMLRNAGNLGIRAGDDDPLGSRFCGNGDLLGFAIPRQQGQDELATKGPVITTYRRYLPGKAAPSEPRMFVQDGGIPALRNLKLELNQLPLLISKWCEVLSNKYSGSDPPSIAARQQAATNLISRLLLSLPLLGMGADVADGRLTLDGRDDLECNWALDRSASHFAELENQLRRLTNDLGAGYQVNPQFPLWHKVITVHPLGGCPTDTSGAEGVVDGYGRVRGVPGLWIADGSVMPGPVGANPSLTIAAFARRAGTKLRKEKLDKPSIPAPFYSGRPRCLPR